MKYSKNQTLSSLEETLDPNDLFAKEKYMDIANYYRVKKNYKSALEYYNKVEKLNVNLDWSFYYYKGICNERLKIGKNLKKFIQISFT